MNPNPTPYLRQFGLSRGATLQQVTARYDAAIEKFPVVMTRDQKEARERLDRSYEVLRRAYRISKSTRTTPFRLRSTPSNSMWIAAGIGAVLLLGAAVLLTMHSSQLSMMMLEFEAGDTVRSRESGEPYGTVVEFEAQHRFPTGKPSSAYRIQLHDSTEAVWVSERIVEQTMVEVGED